MANLFGAPSQENFDELETEEITILKEAGVIPSTSPTSKTRKRVKRHPKHIVFAENEQEGQYIHCTSESSFKLNHTSS